MTAMRKRYGSRAEEIFYRSRNKGTITGVDPESRKPKKRGLRNVKLKGK